MIEKFIDMGIINTYDLMTGKRQFEEIVKEEELPIFFINPEEKCEKCIVLTKLKK